MLLFVYGSFLRKGPSHILIKGSKFIANAILPDHLLYDLEGLEIAAAVPGRNPKGIWGEVYEVADEKQDDLDNYCGYIPGKPSKSLFERKKVQLLGTKKENLEAEAYILPESRLSQFVAVPIPEGRWI